MITERMQKRLVYQALVEGSIESTAIDLTGWVWPWREILLMSERPEVDAQAQFGGRLLPALNMVANGDRDQAREWKADIEDSSEPIHFPSLAEIGDTLPPVRWLWPGWIPRGMLSLLGAFQGTGKSYFVLDLARTVIEGGPWPDGQPVEQIGNVIYVEAEGIPQVTNDRAKSLGLNRQNIWLLMAEMGEMIDLTQAVWQDRLVDMATTLKPELIVIDSLTSISSAGQNSVEDTNRLLMFLVGLSRHVDCGLLVLHHLRKPPGGQMSLPGMSVHDFRGSGHITAMARTVLGLTVVQTGRQFSLNGKRRLDLVKTNLGRYPTGVGIEMKEEGEKVTFTYGEPPSFDQESPGDKAEEWLIEYLEEHGPSKPGDVTKAAEAIGIVKSTLYRARMAIKGVVRDTEKNFRSPTNRWKLADGDDDDDQSDQDDA